MNIETEFVAILCYEQGCALNDLAEVSTQSPILHREVTISGLSFGDQPVGVLPVPSRMGTMESSHCRGGHIRMCARHHRR